VKTEVTLKPAPGITPEQARDARALAWSYVFQCFHRREGQEGSPSLAALDDAMKGSKSDRATSKSSR
jgi:hypothetical protein